MSVRRSVLLVLILAALTLVGASASPSPQVTLSNTGMEGLAAVKVQVHIAGGPDWRQLVGLEEKRLETKVQGLLTGTPGLTVIESDGSQETPRVLVVVVGHVIADASGKKETAATNITVSLNQPVSVRRQTPSGKPILASGTTWHRNLLITGLKSTMRQRVDEKLVYLMGQFRQEHGRANAESPAPVDLDGETRQRLQDLGYIGDDGGAGTD